MLGIRVLLLVLLQIQLIISCIRFFDDCCNVIASADERGYFQNVDDLSFFAPKVTNDGDCFFSFDCTLSGMDSELYQLIERSNDSDTSYQVMTALILEVPNFQVRCPVSTNVYFTCALGCSEEDLRDKSCQQLDSKSENAGSVLYIPYKSVKPVNLPNSFDCKYIITVKQNNWLRITVTNDLSDPSDYIQIDDGMTHISRIDSTTTRYDQFYAISNSTGSITIHTSSPSNSSSVLIKLEYFSLATETSMEMTRNGRVNYIDLNQVYNSPITVVGNEGERIVASVAMSFYKSDDFDGFYIFDGNFSMNSGVYRLDDHLIGSNLVSSGNILTLVGLSSDTSMSSIIFHYLSDISKFDKLAGVSVAEQSGTIKITSSRIKTAVTFLSRNTDNILLNSLFFTDLGNGDPECSAKAVTGSPTDISRELIDFSPSSGQPHVLPQLFPGKFFTLLVEHCSLQLVLSNHVTDNYYDVTDGQVGYIFSPSYIDPMMTSNFNVSYNYNINETAQFSIDIKSVKIMKNVELDVSVITNDLRKVMSIVVTGDQEGTKSRATGNYLNAEMKGSTTGDGYAKLKYTVQASGSSETNITATFVFCFLFLYQVLGN